MGKGKAKLSKSVRKKSRKSRSDSWKQIVSDSATSLRKRWSSANELLVPTNHLRSKDGYSLRSNPQKEEQSASKRKRKDNSHRLKSGKINCNSTVQQSSKKKQDKDRVQHEIANYDSASPWLENQARPSHRSPEINNNNDNSTKQCLRVRRKISTMIPTENVPMEELNRELVAFAEYVQLTPAEQQARRALVQALQEVAVKQQQEVRVFGSFATPQVCVFTSDIDIALWGAIPVPPSTIVKAPPPEPTPAQQKEERKRKRLELWKQALAQVDAANETVPDTVRHASVGSLSEALSATKSEDSSPLFVIDRSGSTLESTESNISIQNSVMNNAPSTHDPCDHSDSSDDSADKMESFQKSPLPSTTHQPTYTRYVSLSSESSDDESVLEDENDDDKKVNNMQVSFTTTPALARTGPTGRTRNKVLDALGSFRQDIRRMESKWIRKVSFITKARVPILKMDTALGVEVDVAVGGHNGTDTSQFAARQVELYKSFSTVVLFLKAFLHQHSLDVPFTGGLGSYKLYVLVAYHIQQYLLAGGQDEPGEVLMSFFFRYGDVEGHNHLPSIFRTNLKQHEPLLYGDDAVADLSNVFNLDACKRLFRESWYLLWRIMAFARNSNQVASSLLRHLIDGHRIRVKRNLCRRQSAQAIEKLLPKKRQSSQDGRESSTKRLRIA